MRNFRKRSGDRGLLKLATVLGMLAAPLALTRPAAAADGCILNDLPSNQGAAISALLSDDTTAFVDGDHDYGKTGFSSPTASGFGGSMPARASSLFMNAGLSDINLSIYMPETNTDGALNFGGSGVNYQGGTFVAYCPQGSGCTFELPSSRNDKNQAWECMREFYRNTSIRAVLQPTGITNGAGKLNDIQTEWRNQVTKRIKGSNGIENTTNVKAYVVIEPFGSYCRRTNTNCGTAIAQSMWDMMRLHWEGTIDPKIGSTASAECFIGTELLCPFPGICNYIFRDKNPLCDAIGGTARVVIDTWIRPVVEDQATMDLPVPAIDGPPFRFARGSTRVSVTGAGADRIQPMILKQFKETPVEQIVTTGILDEIGKALCTAFCPAGTTAPACAPCPNNTVGFGAFAIGQDHDPNTPSWPRRVQLGHYVAWGEPGTAYWSPRGTSAGAFPQLFYINTTR